LLQPDDAFYEHTMQQNANEGPCRTSLEKLTALSHTS